MKSQFSNNLLFSFYLWSENQLLNNGEAFINNNSKLYYTPDERLGSKIAYASPFKQWVYDSGVNNGIVLQNVSGDFGSIERGQSGMMVDYENGRVLFDSAVGTGLNISGNYSIKEFNFYQSNETDEYIIISDKYYFNPRYQDLPCSGIPPYSMTTPAVIITNNKIINEPFAFGGMDDTKVGVSMIVMAESMFQINAINSFFVDKKYKYFPLLDLRLDPINEYGDLKSGYNYNELIKPYDVPGNLVQIENVTSTKMSDKVKTNYKLFLGEIEFELSFPRYPRLNP